MTVKHFIIGVIVVYIFLQIITVLKFCIFSVEFSEIPVKLGDVYEGIYRFWSCLGIYSWNTYEQIIFEEILPADSLKSIAKVS